MAYKSFQKWMSGFARRWHMNPMMSRHDDLVCAHQGRCGQLVIMLWPDHSIELLRAAVTHDAAEIMVGDLSGPFKASGEEVVQKHAQLEDSVLRAMGFAQDLTDLDRERLRFVDQLDAYLFVQLHCPQEVTRNGWTKVGDWLLESAKALGVGAVISDMLGDALMGDV